MNKPLIKALKHVNFLSGHIGTEEELKKHRKLTELVGRVGTPKGDVIRTRKPHPCGGSDWTVTRTGADIKMRCNTCGRLVMLDRDTFLRRSARWQAA